MTSSRYVLPGADPNSEPGMRVSPQLASSRIGRRRANGVFLFERVARRERPKPPAGARRGRTPLDPSSPGVTSSEEFAGAPADRAIGLIDRARNAAMPCSRTKASGSFASPRRLGWSTRSVGASLFLVSASTPSTLPLDLACRCRKPARPTQRPADGVADGLRREGARRRRQRRWGSVGREAGARRSDPSTRTTSRRSAAGNLRTSASP